MNKKIIFLKGLPASGKSTWAKQYCENNPEFIRLNKDDIRMALGNPKWSREFEENVLAIQRGKGLELLKIGKSIIIDDTNFARTHHLFWKNLATQLHAEFEERFFDVDVEECISRDKTREKSVGEAIIRKMWKDYLRPSSLHTDERFILIQEQNLPRAIICDLDGTLALHNGRSPYDNSKISTDKINIYIENVLNRYRSLNIEVIFISGRNEAGREETEKWLRSYFLWFDNDCKFLMRASNDNRSDDIVKKEIYEAYIKNKYFIEFVLDDRDKVVKMWRDLGLLCLQVYYGDF